MKIKKGLFYILSIIQQERSEAVREHISQISQVHADEVDEAYQNGLRKAKSDNSKNETKWFRFGVLCGIALSTLIWSFWP